MKNLVLILVALSSQLAFAYGTTTGEKVVGAVLESKELEFFTNRLSRFRLQQINVNETSRNLYNVKFIYAVPGTQEVCDVAGTVRYSLMEAVGPGGSGFTNRETFEIHINSGSGCPE